MTYADEDLGAVDDRWYCTKAELEVDTFHALDVISSELYKLAAKKLLNR